jgi:outer membrane cobalamin receptor
MKKLLNWHLMFIFLFISHSLFSQEKVQLSGKIVSSKNEGVDFASILVKDTKCFTTPDKSGNYRIMLPPGNYIVIVKALGYGDVEKSLKLTVGKNQVLDFVLQPASVALAEVLVLGKSQVQQINESAYNVVAINAKSLHNTTLDLAHALDRVSGVKIKEVGGLGSNTQIFLNGFSGRHVKIFLDGIPMEGFGSSFRINNIPVNIADRIEVYKGVVPIEFGTDALGGVINIVSNQSKRTYVEASYAYGSFNTHKSNLSLGRTTKNGFIFQLDTYQNYSDNNYWIKSTLLNLNSGNFSKEEYWFKRFHDNYHNEALIAKAGIINKSWTDRLLLGLTLSQEKADIQNSNLMKIVFGGRERKAKSLIPSLNYEKKNLLIRNLNLLISSTYSIMRNNNIDTLARQYNWKGEYKLNSFKGEGEYSMSEYNNSTAFAAANLSYKMDNKHFFALNNLFSTYSRKATNSVANVETTTAATFMRRTNTKNILGFSYKFAPNERWNALAFLKYYEVNVVGPVNVSTTLGHDVYEEQKRSFHTTGYGIALTYFFSKSLQLKTSFEKAYRLPSENELFGDEVLETGDATLGPENSRNINFNVNYNFIFNNLHAVYLDAGFIYRDTRDYIRRQIEQRYGGAYYSNHGQVRTLGFDTEARYFYGKKISLGGNLTMQNIRNMERYTATKQENINYKGRMPNLPYLFGNFDVNYFLPDLFLKRTIFSVGYNLRYLHSFFRDWPTEAASIIIPKQLSHDINLTYTLKDGRYNIAFELKNLTNEILYDNYSLQKPGRSFLIKFRYFFSRT